MRNLMKLGVAGGMLLLAASCGLLDSGSATPAAPQMGGPAFNNAGDNGPMVLLAVVVTVVLIAAGALALAVFRSWREERAEWRAELRALRNAELPADRQPRPQLNGQEYPYQSAVRDRRAYRGLGR